MNHQMPQDTELREADERERVGSTHTAVGAARAAVRAIYEGQTVEYARAAAAKWQDKLLLTMRQMIMLNVHVADRILDFTARFQAEPEYSVLHRREVKRAVNTLAQTVRKFRAQVLMGVDDDWREKYTESQALFNSQVMGRDTTILWYSLRNALLKDKIKLAEPLIELYYVQGLLDINSINTDWKREEMHLLDPVFDKVYKWEVFSDEGIRRRMKELMAMFTTEYGRDKQLPLYPDEFSYRFMDEHEVTKTACNIILTHVNDLDRIVMCLLPEELERHRAMVADMEAWMEEHELAMTMENADGWRRESDLSMEAQAVAQVLADFEARREAAAAERRIFDTVAEWGDLVSKAEEEWQRRFDHNRKTEEYWIDGLRRLHPDWPEEEYQQAADRDYNSPTSIATEPRIEILRERLAAVAPKEVQKANKRKSNPRRTRRAKNTEQ